MATKEKAIRKTVPKKAAPKKVIRKKVTTPINLAMADLKKARAERARVKRALAKSIVKTGDESLQSLSREQIDAAKKKLTTRKGNQVNKDPLDLNKNEVRDLLISCREILFSKKFSDFNYKKIIVNDFTEGIKNYLERRNLVATRKNIAYLFECYIKGLEIYLVSQSFTDDYDNVKDETKILWFVGHELFILENRQFIKNKIQYANYYEAVAKRSYNKYSPYRYLKVPKPLASDSPAVLAMVKKSSSKTSKSKSDPLAFTDEEYKKAIYRWYRDLFIEDGDFDEIEEYAEDYINSKGQQVTKEDTEFVINIIKGIKVEEVLEEIDDDRYSRKTIDTIYHFTDQDIYIKKSVFSKWGNENDPEYFEVRPTATGNRLKPFEFNSKVLREL